MDLKQVNETLNSYIRPQTFPLALKLCASQKELPERVRMPEIRLWDRGCHRELI